MIEKEILVFAFMVSLTVSAQNPDSDHSYQHSDFSRFDILSPNQNRIGHGVYEVSFFCFVFSNFIAILYTLFFEYDFLK